MMEKGIKKKKPIEMKSVKILNQNTFWGQRLQKLREVIVPYQWKILNDDIPGAPKSHALENFRIAAGYSSGEFYGMVFQDSDVAKLIEATSYCLLNYRDPDLERLLDESVNLVMKAQQSDGYLNTYFIIKEPERRWTNLRENHELYTAGHMIEAAVAHYQVPGKTGFFETITRLANHIVSNFGTEINKRKGYPGHPEIEFALLKLYRVSQDRRYLRLAEFFINQRGEKPWYFDLEAKKRNEISPTWPFWTPEYCQAHLPVREQKEAVGHAVRAMYLYSAMADLAYETDDEALFETCKILWNDVTQHKMYITGGIGSSSTGEAFTLSYDLPPDRAYAETCASIGLIFWAQRMLHLDLDHQYADVMERALYNNVLSGVSLDGMKYFYANPLEIWPEVCQKRSDLAHIKTVRQPWFDCACCPTNLARLLGSIGQYIYSQDENTIYVHLFIESEVTFQIGSETVILRQKTNYPWDGDVMLQIHSHGHCEFTLAIRVPRWCKQAELLINGKIFDRSSSMEKGYVKLKRFWNEDDRIELSMTISTELVRAHPKVRSVSGKVAVCQGPIVYCMEEIDNGPNLARIALPREAKFTVQPGKEILKDINTLQAVGLRLKDPSLDNRLYSSEKHSVEEVPLQFIPYYAWNNRGTGEMTVWVRES